MANENWMRTYTMRCGKMGKQGFEIGNVNSVTKIVSMYRFRLRSRAKKVRMMRKFRYGTCLRKPSAYWSQKIAWLN